MHLQDNLPVEPVASMPLQLLVFSQDTPEAELQRPGNSSCKAASSRWPSNSPAASTAASTSIGLLLLVRCRYLRCC